MESALMDDEKELRALNEEDRVKKKKILKEFELRQSKMLYKRSTGQNRKHSSMIYAAETSFTVTDWLLIE